MLREILRTRFGFNDFRPHQEAVCRAVGEEGRDALVVMPTGAGKSLCYQLPGLRRGGTTLVISPLVALIEDQVQSLKAKGMKADRIHSGRTRMESRETLGAYLRKELEFLFIAPERLAVPGFPEMLRQNPPTLIAVDEAHCISHWGHDFRPDYRWVGERLQGITGTPVIALTATATPLVQDDICTQLQLRDPRRFIHGFRRDNLAVRVEETLPSLRVQKIVDTLKPAGRVPAIVYAPTRKKAEELSRELGAHFKCAAYHAGMPANARERVQQAFLEGTIDLIVATIAFGMGIDKPNVRTVIHAALPASLEGYYQEIGRAGRDGLPSEALLFHSFADRKTHEFFLDRDYPDPVLMAKIRHAVPKAGSIPRALLQDRMGSVEPDAFEKALEKLWMHGGLLIDPEENVTLGKDGWRKPYEEQRNHRLRQLDSMQAFTSGSGCRMLQLVHHFGDPADSGSPCGICDRCVPGDSLRVPDETEKEIAAVILASLSGRNGQAVGRLFEEATVLNHKVGRSGFERLLQALERARMIEINQDSFEKDGEVISFRRVLLTSAGREATAEALAQIELEGAPITETRPSRSRQKKAATAAGSGSPRSSRRELPPETPRLFEELRTWRLAEARKRGVPAFRILSDRVLYAICESMPRSEDELLQVPGIGPKIVKQYGAEILGQVGKG